MNDFLANLPSNAVMTLYTFQAITYVTAAALAVRMGHKDIAACYSFSAVLHVGFASCHLFHLA